MLNHGILHDRKRPKKAAQYLAGPNIYFPRHIACLAQHVRESRLTAAAAAERDRGLEDDLQDALYVSRNDAVRRAHVARDLARMRACNK